MATTTTNSTKSPFSNEKYLVTEAIDLVGKTAKNKRETAELIKKQTVLRRNVADKSAKSNALQSGRLSEMIDKQNRIEEIEQSPMLRVVEPIAGLFNKKFSRRALADDIKTDKTAFALQSAQDELTLLDAQTKTAELDAEKRRIDSELAGERGDVAALVTLVGAEGKLEDAVLLTGSKEEIAAEVAKGTITQTQADNAKRLSKDKKVQSQLAELRLAKEESNVLADNLTKMDDIVFDKMLLDGSPDYSQRELQLEDMRRVAYKSSIDRIIIADKLRDTGTDKLDTLAVTDNVPQSEIDKTKLARQQSEQDSALLDLAKERLGQDAERMRIDAQNLLLSQLDANELRDVQTALAAAEGGNDVEFTSSAGDKVMLENVDSAVIDARLAMLDKGVNETAMQQVIMAQANVNFLKVSQQIGTMVGLDIPEDATFEDTMASFAALPGTSSELASEFAQLSASLKVVNTKFSGNSTAQAEAMVVINTQLTETMKKFQLEKLARESNKAAHVPLKNLWLDGEFAKQSDAVTILAIEHQEITGFPSLDASLNEAINAARAYTAPDDSLIVGPDATDAQIQFAAVRSALPGKKTLSTEDKLQLVLSASNNALHTAMGTPIQAKLIPEAWAQAAEDLNQPGMAASIRNGAAGRKDNGEWQELTMISELREQGVNIDEFIAAVQERSLTVASRFFKARPGSDNRAFAAINRIVYGNNIDTSISHDIQIGIRDGIRGEKATQNPITTGGLLTTESASLSQF